MQTIINHISKRQPLILLILGKNYISIILSYSIAFRTKLTNTIRYGHQALIAKELEKEKSNITKRQRKRQLKTTMPSTAPTSSGVVIGLKPLPLSQNVSDENILTGQNFADNIIREKIEDLFNTVSSNYTIHSSGYSIIHDFQIRIYDHIHIERKYGKGTQNAKNIVKIMYNFCKYSINIKKRKQKQSISEFIKDVLTADDISYEINIEESNDLLENVGFKIDQLQNDDLNWFSQLYEIYSFEMEKLKQSAMEYKTFVEAFNKDLNDVIPAEYELLNNIEAKNYFKKIIGIALEKLNNDNISIDSSVLRNQCQLITSDYDCEHDLKLWIELSSLVMYKLCPAIQICYVTPRQTMSKYLTVQRLRNCHHLLVNHEKRKRHYRFCIHKIEKCVLKLSPIRISER